MLKTKFYYVLFRKEKLSADLWIKAENDQRAISKAIQKAERFYKDCNSFTIFRFLKKINLSKKTEVKIKNF